MKNVFSTLSGLLGVVFTAIVVILVVITVFFQGVWVSERRAVEALTSQGYSDVEILDKDVTFLKMRGCSSEDDAAFQVTATNAAGKKVENIVVCVGWPFKGGTIRFK